ncbi:unnamed protein product, partial [Chrysoparadoxa australica]
YPATPAASTLRFSRTMGDLEDTILKKNIPGKYSRWEKDEDEVGPNSRAEWIDEDASDPEAELSEMQQQRKWVEADMPEPLRRGFAARQAREKEEKRAQTGVKGVLSEYKAYQESMKAGHTQPSSQLFTCTSSSTSAVKLDLGARTLLHQRMHPRTDRQLQAEYRDEMLRRMTMGVQEAPVGTVTSTDLAAEDDSEEEEDDAFLEEYRKQRMLELQANEGRPSFGGIREVGRIDFVEAVDAVDPRTPVVVHLYEPYIKACKQMNRALEVIAREHSEVKFLRMLSTSADGEYDPIALPTLMIYQGRDLVACLPRVTDDIGADFEKADVEWLLQEHDIFETAKPKPS